jgi:SAM-dependent methyltransferase
VNADNKISHSSNWSYILFVENPLAYLPFLENQRKDSVKEVDGLVKLLSQSGIRDGSKILDFSCGIGRHSIELAKRGYKVVGYDPSPMFVEIAKKCAGKEIVDTSRSPIFYQGNPYYLSRLLLNETGFDAILIMDNSIGYAGTSGDLIMLKALNKIGRKDCVLIIEAESRDWRLRNFESLSVHEFENIIVREEWKFYLEISQFESLSSFYKKLKSNNKSSLQKLLQLRTTMRLYSLHELIALLKECKWKYLGCYDSITNIKPVNIDSGPNVVTVSTRV